MIADAKFHDVLQKLLAKSRADQVIWREKNSVHGGSEFIVDIGSTHIKVGFFSPSSEPDRYWAELIGENGKNLKSLYVEEDDKNPDWTLITDLYNEAYRSATGWDKALDEIERALDSEDVIGSPFN